MLADQLQIYGNAYMWGGHADQRPKQHNFPVHWNNMTQITLALQVQVVLDL